MSALCDSGADITCLPAYVVQRLGLIEVDEVEVGGSYGATEIKPYTRCDYRSPKLTPESFVLSVPARVRLCWDATF